MLLTASSDRISLTSDYSDGSQDMLLAVHCFSADAWISGNAAEIRLELTGEATDCTSDEAMGVLIEELEVC